MALHGRYLVVLLQEDVHVLKEADRGRAVDDNLHVSTQPRQVRGAQSTVLSVDITFHDSQLTQRRVQGLLGACISLEKRLGLQKTLQALQSCRATRAQSAMSCMWEPNQLSIDWTIIRAEHMLRHITRIETLRCIFLLSHHAVHAGSASLLYSCLENVAE